MPRRCAGQYVNSDWNVPEIDMGVRANRRLVLHTRIKARSFAPTNARFEIETHKNSSEWTRYSHVIDQPNIFQTGSDDNIRGPDFHIEGRFAISPICLYRNPVLAMGHIYTAIPRK